MTEWISVKDRLPELDAPILAWVSTYYQNRGGFEIAMRWAQDGKWWTLRACELRNSVTHWMPLPEPPAE